MRFIYAILIGIILENGIIIKHKDICRVVRLILRK
jgi:hypothetical protein